MASPFLKALREDIRLRGYSIRTEKTYVDWITRFIRFTGLWHPAEVDTARIKELLTYLAVERHVSVNTQKTALNAIIYLYQKFLKLEVGKLGFTLSSRQRRLPTVLTPHEIKLILSQLTGRNRLIIELLYGSGLRVNECLRLRVKDIDLERLSLTVHDGKGRKDRQTSLGAWLVSPLKTAIASAMEVQARDNERGLGCSVPPALARKYPTLFRNPG